MVATLVVSTAECIEKLDLCCTPKTNVTLCANYIQIKKILKRAWGRLGGSVGYPTLDFGSGHDPGLWDQDLHWALCQAWSLFKILSLLLPLPPVNK